MGYLRVRRSIKLGPGVKLNLSKRSMGLTVGGRGAHSWVNTRGMRTTRVGLPGTGVSYIDRSSIRRSSGRRSTPRTFAAQPVAVQPAAPQHPGIFARHYERAFSEGVAKLTA